MGNQDLFNAFETNLRNKLKTVMVGDYVCSIPLINSTYVGVSFKVSGEQKKDKFATKGGNGEYEDSYYYLVTEIKLRNISYAHYKKDKRFHCDIDFTPIFNKVANEFINTKINF